MNLRALLHTGVTSLAILALTACGGGGGGEAGAPAAAQASNLDSGCIGFCATSTPANLTVGDVQQVIAQAVQEATARGAFATIAVVDRVGNVLGIFQMTGAGRTFNIQTGTVNTLQGLENINGAVPSDLAAIAKAITGAYLASEGNAFSTRVASQIVQQHFNPHEFRAPGGPLFGVQFSQLPCSDMVQQGNVLGIGPRRSPLGLSADPGGFPLYKNGHPVGGIGVITDGLYSLDRNVLNTDFDIDEHVALAGTFGFAPANDRLADRITVDGRTLRYSDAEFDNLLSNPAAASFAAIGGLGALIDDNRVNLAAVSNPLSAQNYFVEAGGIRAGTTFAQPNSGIEDADVVDATLYPGLDAFVLTDGAGTNRFPPTAGVADLGTGTENLTVNEVRQLMRSALGVANIARAQIRRPLNSQARVTISVVGPDGAILAIARTRDAPMFGTDVSLQKARTATFFSSVDAGAELNTLPDADASAALAALTYNSPIGDYVGAVGVGGVRDFLGTNTALTGTHAFADRSGGNLSRPFYPDGIDFNTNGPLSKPYVTAGHDDNGVSTDIVLAATNEWSPFNTGLQLDLVYNNLIEHLAGANETDCIGALGAGGGFGGVDTTRLANGIQIFPGSVPVYKNGQLVGGIGVSGDGIEQDDMISFLGTFNASIALGGDGIANAGDPNIGNADPAIRADTITPPAFPGQSLRYIQCPQNPFLNSTQENVCDGI